MAHPTTVQLQQIRDEGKEPERTFAAALLEIRSMLRDLERELEEVKAIVQKVKSRQ